jgi:hypothetical protein
MLSPAAFRDAFRKISAYPVLSVCHDAVGAPPVVTLTVWSG